MKALLWTGARLDTVGDIEVREPLAGEVAVRIEAAGLCHSDLKGVDGDIEQPVPVVLGHEAAGVIVARGPGVTARIGQKVVLSPLRTCGRCAACRAGRPTLCRGTSEPMQTVFSRAGEKVHQFVRIGAFARRTVVTEAQVIPVPDALPDTIAALLGCAVITGFGAVWERARVQRGESVLVIGAGGIGLNVIQAAKVAGADSVVVCDTNPRKESIARRLGATDFRVGEVAAIATAVAPNGFDAVFECVGRPELLAAGIDALAWGGRAVMVGLPPEGTNITFAMRRLFQDKAVLGCRMGSVDPHRFIPDLARRYLAGEIDLDPLVTDVVPLSQGARLVERLRAGELDRGVFDLAAGEPTGDGS
ncbi:alcohol dehydrogenase catalytic domain-containing protein [Amycolatopsis sp. K13G38]|uniref:Alcohol dehydrogenase catalytic domain-containing protein n=1 Tax=Amycolatopsis acididurans TaxID=2724524 RepID=A0ABX1IY33_9PSEU|nr:alcohol dehydrogenase catalytic domain-containing protein [Amycolatopsis acididurans]NKQ52428.1 alcohol dehydrogenase catalytic domain-containing protein [Amycolatopsis acididurans]